MTDRIEDTRQPDDRHAKAWDEQGESVRRDHMMSEARMYILDRILSSQADPTWTNADCADLLCGDLFTHDDFAQHCEETWNESQGVT